MRSAMDLGYLSFTSKRRCEMLPKKSLEPTVKPIRGSSSAVLKRYVKKR